MSPIAIARRRLTTSAPLGLALGALLACAPASSSPARREGVHQERTLHLTAVGDILLGDSSRKVLEREGYDYPFRGLAPLLQRSDLVFANLEGPITKGTTPLDPKKDYVYRSDPAAAPALHAAHVELVTLANNHALDYGNDGLSDTIRHLDAAGVRHFGAGANRAEAIGGEIVELAGVRIGFLGFFERYGPYGTTYAGYFAGDHAPGVAELDERTLREAIAALRPRVDVLIVCCHWGKNYAAVTKTQQRYGHLAAELGADLVVGHHPHVAQGVEVHHGVPILYSVGNFTFGSKGRFDQLEPPLRHSWLAEITVNGGRIDAVDLIPLETDNHVVRYQPRVAEAGDLAAMVAKLNEPFATALTVEGGRAHLDLHANPTAAR
jgi:poly-gamma-glutamate synthesis protein (capsule biosynthesis protein)